MIVLLQQRMTHPDKEKFIFNKMLLKYNKYMHIPTWQNTYTYDIHTSISQYSIHDVTLQSITISYLKQYARRSGVSLQISLCSVFNTNVFNPFPMSVPIWHRLAKLSILILEGIIKKISYERRDYESVDEKSLS